MNVFTDFHHASLLESFILLFKKRLGGNVYRPIGMDWYDKGFWKVFEHPETVAQFLGIGAATPDGTPPLNQVDGMQWQKDVYPGAPYLYFCRDIDSGKFNTAITFDGFMQTDINIVIASLPQHIEPYKRLCELHPSKPKLIYQIGNQWNVGENIVKNVMASANIDNIPEGINFVKYHQEFDTEIFSPFSKIVSDNDILTFPAKNIYSFVNVFNGQSHFAGDWELFRRMEQVMSDWSFKSYGGQCRDGSMNGSEELAHKMREARFIWHTKAGGDGYGHVIHNAAAVGRPLIVKREYYQGKLADALIKDGETAIVIDGLDNEQIRQKIEYYSEPTRYAEMCCMVYENFKKVCNFDEEFVKIQAFLNQLS